MYEQREYLKGIVWCRSLRLERLFDNILISLLSIMHITCMDHKVQTCYAHFSENRDKNKLIFFFLCDINCLRR